MNRCRERDVRVGDAAGDIGQHQRHRRVLHHGIQQQFALRQMLTLVTQGLSQRVVHADQIAQFVAPIHRDREAEIAVAITGHRAFQRAQQPAYRLHHLARQPECKQQQRRHANTERAVETQMYFGGRFGHGDGDSRCVLDHQLLLHPDQQLGQRPLA